MAKCLLVLAWLLGCTPNRVKPPGLAAGSGAFQAALATGGAPRSIEVFYYKPKGFSDRTRFVLVIPGAGRNASDYRDRWVRSADQYNLMVLSPRYPEADYDFSQYHLGRIVGGLQITELREERLNGRVFKYRVADENIRFSTAHQPGEFLFEDFDRIFEQARLATGAAATDYDLFGHSAGGQVLHRHALFAANSKARRIVAANSGFYTLPNKATPFPFGLKGTALENGDLKVAFARNLVVLLGEKDDQKETRGKMLHTPTLDRRGLGRVERGHHFFESSRQHARKLATDFNWKLEVVANVGHDYRRMGRAAARLLYSSADE